MTSKAHSISGILLTGVALLMLGGQSCTLKTEKRHYKMTWTAEPTIHESWKGAEDVELTFVDKPTLSYHMVSYKLGQVLRSKDKKVVDTVWETQVNWIIDDEPGILLEIEGIEMSGQNEIWSCWSIQR